MLFTTPFQRALSLAKGSLRILKGSTVLYSDGSDAAPLEVTARLGATTFRVDTGDQFNLHVRTVDFLILVDDLQTPEGVPFLPSEGHRITVPIDESTSDVYECLPVNGEPGWRYSDTTRSEYRIHTKRVAPAPAAPEEEPEEEEGDE